MWTSECGTEATESDVGPSIPPASTLALTSLSAAIVRSSRGIAAPTAVNVPSCVTISTHRFATAICLATAVAGACRRGSTRVPTTRLAATISSC